MQLSTLLLLAATTVLSNGNADTAGGLQVKLLTFNIRYGTANDGDNAWPHRQEMVGNVIRDEAPDFCGLQEALRFQIDAVRQAVPEYAECGVGREDGKTKGEYSAILYRRDRWQLDRGDTVWLSDTPTEPGSASWGNTIPRIVTWGRFVEKETGRAIFVFNTHFDHRSQPSREKSAEFTAALILREAKGEPVVLMGDLNAGEQNPAILRLKQKEGENAVGLVDTFRVVHPDAKDVGTFNGFEGRTDGEKIDFVFVNPSAKVVSAEILRSNRDGRYPSDHFPVNAELVFPMK
ncbi:MAG: endonuclease/exonuclease/phosphatase family protein [Planctomycetaceae bacterium]|nr:endonuclease/exonuclease/phosphatase family protein [Planctomycetaceae bacterium]